MEYVNYHLINFGVWIWNPLFIYINLIRVSHNSQGPLNPENILYKTCQNFESNNILIYTSM